MTKTPDWNVYAVEQANRAKTRCRYVDRSVALGEVPNLARPLVLRQNDEGQFILARSFKDLGLAVFFGNDGFLQAPRFVRRSVFFARCLASKASRCSASGYPTRGNPRGSHGP